MVENIYSMTSEQLEDGKRIITFFQTLGMEPKDIDKLVFLAKNADRIMDLLAELSTATQNVATEVLNKAQMRLADKAKKLREEYTHREELNLNA